MAKAAIWAYMVPSKLCPTTAPSGTEMKRESEATTAAREGASPPVFTSGCGKPVNEKQLCPLLRKQRNAAVPHVPVPLPGPGGRGDESSKQVIEAALAHVVRNKLETAYAGSNLLERWRVLMDDWARYLAHRKALRIRRLYDDKVIFRRRQKRFCRGRRLGIHPLGLDWTPDDSRCNLGDGTTRRSRSSRDRASARMCPFYRGKPRVVLQYGGSP